MNHKELKQAVKRIAREFDPEARVWLYGSRARGDATAESDWDFLILLRSEIGKQSKEAMRLKFYETEWDTGEVICSIIRTQEEFKAQALPLYMNVVKEGFEL